MTQADFENEMKNKNQGVDKATANTLLVFQKTLKTEKASVSETSFNIKTDPLEKISFNPTINTSLVKDWAEVSKVALLAVPYIQLTGYGIAKGAEAIGKAFMSYIEDTKMTYYEQKEQLYSLKEDKYKNKLDSLKTQLYETSAAAGRAFERMDVISESYTNESNEDERTSLVKAFKENLDITSKALDDLEKLNKDIAKTKEKYSEAIAKRIEASNKQEELREEQVKKEEAAEKKAQDKKEKQEAKETAKKKKEDEKKTAAYQAKEAQYKKEQAEVTARILAGINKMSKVKFIINEGEDDERSLNPLDEDQSLGDFFADMGKSMKSVGCQLLDDLEKLGKQQGLNFLSGFISRGGRKAKFEDKFSNYISSVSYDELNGVYLIETLNAKNVIFSKYQSKFEDFIEAKKEQYLDPFVDYYNLYIKDYSAKAETLLIQKQMGKGLEKVDWAVLCEAIHNITTSNPAFIGCGFDLYFPSLRSLTSLDNSKRDGDVDWRNFRIKGFTIPELKRETGGSHYGYSSFTTVSNTQPSREHFATISFIIDKNLDQLEYLLIGSGLAQRTSGSSFAPKQQRTLDLSSIANPSLNEAVTASLYLRNGRDLRKSYLLENPDWSFETDAPTKKYLKMDYKLVPGVPQYYSCGPQDSKPNEESGDEVKKVKYADTYKFMFENFKIINVEYSLSFDTSGSTAFEVQATCTWTKTLLKSESNVDYYKESLITT